MSFGKVAAKSTLKNVKRLEGDIKRAAGLFHLPSSLVAAIVSRETNASPKWCKPPKDGGLLGDNGYGHGPMQIDKRSFPEWCQGWRDGTATTYDGISMGCTVLRQKLRTLEKLIPEMSAHDRLRAAVAAYNCGEGNVKKAFKAGADIDSRTTGKNYSADVLERAEYFKGAGFDS